MQQIENGVPGVPPWPRPTLSIGVKALNEEEHIGSCLESALAAVREWGGEVVLADSGSSDATVDIALARGAGVCVVQLADSADRSCGAGAQLAYQYATGEYFYLIDGDMVVRENFVAEAITYLESHPDVAAVGGRIVERHVINEEFRIRNESSARPGGVAEAVDRLDGGGVYRQSALRELGYFADRNLHSFEEFELAARLRCAGWRLVRLDLPAVDHFGHRMSGYKLLWRRIRSGYAAGLGEVVRSAIGTAHLAFVLRDLKQVRQATLVVLWWATLLACAWIDAKLALVLLAIAPLIFLATRRRSLALGLYSYVSWNVNAVGLVVGLLRRRTDPTVPLKAVELSAP